MSIVDALIYGLVQGLTEYLPISSSAHLILLPQFLGRADPGLTFDVFLHVGTLFATVFYFRKDWLGMVQGQSAVSFRLIVIATIPALIAGALIRPLSGDVLRSNALMVGTLVVGGILLYGVDALRPQGRRLEGITVRDAVIVGLAQCLALLPGMSRSGSTIMGGRFLGFDRASAARFSFLMSAPVTLAAIVFEMRHWGELVESSVGLAPLLVACVSAFVSGWIAIGILLNMVRRFGYLSFALYRVGLALVIWRILGI